MKKIIIIGICIFFISLITISADYTTPSQAWHFDDTDPLLESVNGQNNFTNTGVDFGRPCKFGECGYFDGSDILTSMNLTFGDSLATYSLCSYSKTNVSGSTSHNIYSKNNGASNAYTLTERWQDDDLWYLADGASILIDTTASYSSTMATGAWVQICIVYDGANETLYRDGNFIISVAETGSTSILSYVFEVGGVNGGGNWVGEIDEICFWENYVLTGSDLTALQTNPCGSSAPPAQTPSATFTTNLTSYVNETANVGFWLNATGTLVNITDRWNIWLWYNDEGSPYESHNDVAMNETALELNLSYCGEEISKNISAIMFNLNSTGGYTGYNYNFDKYEIFLDCVLPNEEVAGVAEGKIYYKNYSDTNIGASSFYFNATITDPNLLATNLTIKNSTGGAISNHFKDDINSSPYSNYTAFSLNNYPAGNYSLHVQAWDSHTAKEIKDYKIKDTTFYSKKAYEIEDDIYIFGDDINKIDFVKEIDRYTFDIDFKKTNPIIEVYAPDLQYIENSEYSAHFVSLSKNKWIDFVNDGGIVDYVITEKNSGHYSIQLITTDQKIKFKSIGDLNTIDVTYNFTLSESFYVYAVDLETNISINDFTITAYNDTSSQTINTTTGVVVFNFTSGNYIFNFSATSFIDQSVENINITSGGNYIFNANASNAFKVYIKDQLTLSLISGQQVNLEFIDAGFNSSENYSTSVGVKYITNLTPSDYIIRYSSANYTTDFYYFTLINGTNTEFTIYMLPNSTTDEITATVVDEINNPIADAYIHVQRYDINTNTYPTVSIVKTNFEGVAKLQVTKNTEFYKFLIYYNSELKKSIAPTYIFEDEINFQIKLTEDVAENFFTTQGITHSLSYNEVTENFKFMYADASNTITSGILRVYNVTSLKEVLVGETELSAVSGTILINAPNVSGTTYKADTYVNINGEEIYLGSGYFTYPISDPLTEEKNMVFYLVLLTILFSTMSYFDIRIAVLLAPLPWVLGSVLNWIPLAWYVTGILEILAVFAVGIMTYSGVRR